MTTRIRRLSPHQNAKVVALVMTLTSIVLLLPMLLVGLARPMGHGPPWPAFVILPLLNGVVTYGVVAAGCWVYNRVAGRVGGLEFESVQVVGPDPRTVTAGADPGRPPSPTASTTDAARDAAAVRSDVLPVDDEVIVRTVTLPIPTGAAFELFSDGARLASWLCHRAKVEPRVGGAYELFWDPDDPANDSTVGCRITAFVAGRLIGFQWRSPRAFKAFANAADPLTHVVVSFHGDDAGATTQVVLVHSGWRSSARWRDAAAWQATAWDHALQALSRRASSGPPGQA